MLLYNWNRLLQALRELSGQYKAFWHGWRISWQGDVDWRYQHKKQEKGNRGSGFSYSGRQRIQDRESLDIEQFCISHSSESAHNFDCKKYSLTVYGKRTVPHWPGLFKMYANHVRQQRDFFLNHFICDNTLLSVTVTGHLDFHFWFDHALEFTITGFLD